MENKEVEATETVYGIICVRKGQYEGKDIWFATVGNQCVSRGTKRHYLPRRTSNMLMSLGEMPGIRLA